MTETLHIEPSEGVRQVAELLLSGGHDALLVGGVVRDALLGKASQDFDLVTDATPDRVRELIAGCPAIRGLYDLGERFGTIGAALDSGGRVEITRFRPDALTAHTSEERFAIDASHRDFTVNALAVDLKDGRLYDPLRGRADLEEGVLRAPSAAGERFAEDPLRVVRAARFAAELGFEVEPETRKAMPLHAPSLTRVAPERIREELTKLLVAPSADRGLRLLCDSGALEAVLPEVAALDAVTQPTFHDLDVLAHTVQTVSLAPATPVLRWAALLHDVGKGPARTVEPDGRIRFFRHAQIGAEITQSILSRLRFSNAETRAIVHLVAEHMRLGDVNFENARSVDRAVRKLDVNVDPADPLRKLVSAEDAVELTLADFGATAHRDEAPLLRQVLERAVAESRQRGTQRAVTSPVGGRQLMHELRLAEGPAVGVAKAAIENAIDRGEIESDDREGALRVARQAVGYHLDVVSSRDEERT